MELPTLALALNSLKDVVANFQLTAVVRERLTLLMEQLTAVKEEAGQLRERLAAALEEKTDLAKQLAAYRERCKLIQHGNAVFRYWHDQRDAVRGHINGVEPIPLCPKCEDPLSPQIESFMHMKCVVCGRQSEFAAADLEKVIREVVARHGL